MFATISWALSYAFMAITVGLMGLLGFNIYKEFNENKHKF